MADGQGQEAKGQDRYDALIRLIRRDRARKRVRWCQRLPEEEWPAERLAAALAYLLALPVHGESKALSRNNACDLIGRGVGLQNLDDKARVQTGYSLLRLLEEARLIESIAHSGEGRGTVPVVWTRHAEKRLANYLARYQLTDLPKYPLLTKPAGISVSGRAGVLDPPAIPKATAAALEKVQGTRWRVNRFIAEKLQQYINSLAPRTQARKEWQRCSRALALASKFVDCPGFYLPVTLDYRGRVYHTGLLRFTGADHTTQALLEFADGESIADERADDFERYVAAVWGVPAAEASGWAHKNCALLRKVVESPLAHREWLEQPKERDQFRALAAAHAWCEYREGRAVHLPCSWDVSSSGLQVYAALMRDTELAKRVGLVVGSEPVIYRIVASKADCSRNEAKAVVIPLLYGAADKTLAAALTEHRPRATDAERLALARRIKKRAVDCAFSFVRVRDWLTREVVPQFAAVGKPLAWTTPGGFAVIQDNRETVSERFTIYYNDERVRLFHSRKDEALRFFGRDSIQKAVAANIIHSLDANVLVELIRAGSAPVWKYPITSIGVVHDCFAVHPNQIGTVIGSYLAAFHRVFKRDWLLDLWRQFEQQLGYSVPPPPDRFSERLPRDWVGARAVKP